MQSGLDSKDIGQGVRLERETGRLVIFIVGGEHLRLHTQRIPPFKYTPSSRSHFKPRLLAILSLSEHMYLSQRRNVAILS